MLEKAQKTVRKPAKSMLDDLVEKPELPADFPVLPAAAPQMKIDVVVNADLKVWVIHDQPFPDVLEWVEFDVETGMMTFVTIAGKLQDLGMVIHPPMDQYVAQAKEVCLMMIRNKEIRDMGLVPLTVQNHAVFRGGT